MAAASDVPSINARVFLGGLYFGEGPRWHDGRLWYSDFYDHSVHAVSPDGEDELMVELDQPSGLGWMPDGSLLVVSMIDRRVLRWDGEVLTEHADLGDHATFHANDLVVDSSGQAYVGNFGFDYDAYAEAHGPASLVGDPGPPTAVLCRVDPDGSVHAAADGLSFPNGMAITPDGGTLIVAETFGMRLTAFDRSASGELGNRRVWADLAGRFVMPDGISLDAEGAVWVANAMGPECLRVAEGGDVLATVVTSQTAFACMLGGTAKRDLFVMTARTSQAGRAAASPQGRVEIARVDVPGAGWP